MKLEQLRNLDWVEGFDDKNFKITISFATSKLITWCQKYAESVYKADYAEYFDRLRQNFDADMLKGLLREYFQLEVESMNGSATVILATPMLEMGYIDRQDYGHMTIETWNIVENEIRLICDSDCELGGI